MKQFLIMPQNEKTKHFRANLHSHTVLSDGHKTPEEIKKLYKDNGYSVLCITDHDLFIPHNDLTDESFLMLNGYELDTTDENGDACHFCFVALDKNMDIDILYHRTKYISEKYNNGKGSRRFVRYDESKEDYERSYTPECVSDMMRKGRENNFFVTYNHPAFSMENYPKYIRYYGMHAMEIVNSLSLSGAIDDDNGHCYDDFLRDGRRLFCIATDDTHNHAPDYSKDSEAFGGYTVIVAEQLTYENIAESLKAGKFYSVKGTVDKRGPEITSLSYDDGEIHVETSDAKSIWCMFYPRRYGGAANAPLDGAINEATFRIGEKTEYFRIVVTDKCGNKAYSNAYFIDDLKKAPQNK